MRGVARWGSKLVVRSRGACDEKVTRRLDECAWCALVRGCVAARYAYACFGIVSNSSKVSPLASESSEFSAVFHHH